MPQTSIPQPPWISTFSGRRLSLSNPQCDQICLEDIANGLSQEPRFAGQTFFHWSVASHTLLMVEAAYKYIPVQYPHYVLDRPHDDLIAAILLHDASEAYGKDLPRPLKLLYPQLADFHNTLTETILSCYGVTSSTSDQHFISLLDNGILYAEAQALLPNGITDWSGESLPSTHNHIPINLAELKYGIHERSISGTKAMLLRQLHDYVGE